MRFLRLLRFPGLEFLPFGSTLFLLLDDLVKLLLLVRLEHGTDIGLRFLLTGGDFILHGFLVSGENTHHMVEASFKAVGRALRQAIRPEGRGVPSTKGVL